MPWPLNCDWGGGGGAEVRDLSMKLLELNKNDDVTASKLECIISSSRNPNKGGKHSSPPRHKHKTQISVKGSLYLSQIKEGVTCSHCTVEPHYNEVLGTMKITLLYQVSHYITVKKQRNIKSWDQQNYLVITGFCYIRPLYNEVPLYYLPLFSFIISFHITLTHKLFFKHF